MTERITIKDTLASWGIEKAMDKPANGYPHQSAFARFIVNRGDSADKSTLPVGLPDDIHGLVDAAVSSLAVKKPTYHEVICRAYITRLPDHTIAELMRSSRSSVRTMREAGEAWVESRLYVDAEIIIDGVNAK
jgi:hypothetical protein